MEVHTSDEWLRVQIGSWPHLHCTTEGGKNCDYLALKPPPAPWPFLNEALSPHIPHPGLPTISLKTLIFFRDYVHLFYPWCFSEHCFCFSFFHLTMCILNFTIFLSHISTIHKSTENNINIVNTHEPAEQDLNILPYLLQIFLQNSVTVDNHYVPLTHLQSFSLLPSPETATPLVFNMPMHL